MNSPRVLRISLISFYLLGVSLLTSGKGVSPITDSLEWRTVLKKEYTVHYTDIDSNKITYIDSCVESGLNYITRFFQQSFPGKFDVDIFPNRALMDKQWQKDWGDTVFRSECWMIASGVAHRLDLLSPGAWKNEACDHNANDMTEIRKVIWHELVHVFHGQVNPDHTFSYIEKLDWLVEGVATIVSGQLDEERLQRIKKMIKDNKTPSTLDNFWKGQDKYGLSGTMVAFIDKKYGRKKLFDLLQQTKKDAVLNLLAISETQLLAEWKNFFQ